MADQARGYPLLSNLDPKVAEFARLVWDSIYRLGDSVDVLGETTDELAESLTEVSSAQSGFTRGSTVLAAASGLTPGFVVSGGSDGQVLTLRSNSPPKASFQNLGALQLGLSELDNLKDVVVPTPTSGEVLQFDGTNWVNAARGFVERGKVTHSVLQNILDATDTVLAFDTERIDPGAMHDPVTNNSRMTVGAGQDGDYLLGASISWEANFGLDTRQVQLLKNGTTVIASANQHWISGAFTADMPVTMFASLVETDFVEVRVHQNSGSPLDIEKTADFSPEFWWTRVA